MGIHLTGSKVVNGVNLSAYKLMVVANYGSTFNKVGSQWSAVGMHYAKQNEGNMATLKFG
jgi:hypothetical protein